MKRLTVKTVAKEMHVTEETVRKGIQQKVLPFGECIKGKRNIYLIYQGEFEKWLQEKKGII